MDVKVSWVLPTTRESGRPLDVADIAGVEISLSADGGANYGVLGQYLPDVLEMTQTDLEIGEWFFRAVVVDKSDPPRRSAPVSASVLIADMTAPGAAVLTLALV